MNSKLMGWVVAAVAVVALFVVLQRQGGGGRPGAAPGDEPSAYVDAGGSVAGADVDRLPAGRQRMRGMVEISGRGARAENGYEVSCDFFYVTEVSYESLVKERSVTPAGEVRVVETRRYDQCNDQITYGDFDVRLSLETLPIRQIEPYVATVAEFVGGAFGAATGAGTAAVAAGVEGLFELDGASARKTLGVLFGIFGEDAPVDAASWIERIARPNVQRLGVEVKRAAQEISGREYLVTYYQTASGEPLRVKFERTDGAPLTMEEHRILREMNVFLSCSVIPARGPAVGESWNVQVGDLTGAFDSLSGGNKVSGELRATRLPDESDGSWKVDFGGGRVAVLDDNGMESGSFMVKNGCALAEPSGRQLRALELTGTGKLRVAEAKKRFIALEFLGRTDGDCEVRITLASEGAR